MDMLSFVQALDPMPSTSDKVIYDQQELQSGGHLAVVYQPFDPDRRTHWSDRGGILDFAVAAGGGHVLDFGPGDGWPSLGVAAYAASVTGVDASTRRLAVCEENARRLGIANFRTAVAPAGGPLPLEDGCMDAVLAASSLEQSPDPLATLREFYRVLRPGGRLRIYFESLNRYRGGREQLAWAWETVPGETYLVCGHRRVDAEAVDYWGVRLKAPLPEVEALAGGSLRWREAARMELGGGAELLRLAAGPALTCSLRQPGAATLIMWLRHVGFSSAVTTHWGGAAAAAYFDALPPADRPRDLAGVERMLWPVIQTAAALAAPLELDQPVLAVK